MIQPVPDIKKEVHLGDSLDDHMAKMVSFDNGSRRPGTAASRSPSRHEYDSLCSDMSGDESSRGDLLVSGGASSNSFNALKDQNIAGYLERTLANVNTSLIRKSTRKIKQDPTKAHKALAERVKKTVNKHSRGPHIKPLVALPGFPMDLVGLKIRNRKLLASLN